MKVLVDPNNTIQVKQVGWKITLNFASNKMVYNYPNCTQFWVTMVTAHVYYCYFWQLFIMLMKRRHFEAVFEWCNNLHLIYRVFHLFWNNFSFTPYTLEIQSWKHLSYCFVHEVHWTSNCGHLGSIEKKATQLCYRYVLFTYICFVNIYKI